MNWEFEVTVLTPDGQELTYRTTYPKGYMDKSMVSNGFYRLTDSAVRELDARDELN